GLGAHRVLWCPGSPRRINEFLWESTTPDGLLRRLLAEHAADVLLCTHTGLKWRRVLDGGAAHAVNVGAVGRPENDGTPRVWYALLTARPDIDVEFVPVAYDHEAAARAVEAEGLPAGVAETWGTGGGPSCLETMPPRGAPRGGFCPPSFASRPVRPSGPRRHLHKEAPMIRVSVLYPTSEGKKFDVDYYVNKHMKLVRERLTAFGLVRTEVDKGVAGGRRRRSR